MRTVWTTVAAVLGALATATTIAIPGAAAGPPAVSSAQPLTSAATPPGAVGSQRFFYPTTTVGDRPTTASAAVYFPPGPAPAGGWPVIAWAHGTVGLADACAYSSAGPVDVSRDWSYVGTWLEQGYAIVAADYAGLGTPGDEPYLDGLVEAHNVVDAVHAAVGHYRNLSRRWVVVGQSQGAGAAVVTARHATEFGGPDLDYRGAVATGVPAHIEDVLMPLGPGIPPVALGSGTTSYVLYILNGLRTAFPGLRIEDYLTDAGRYWLNLAHETCLNQLDRAVGDAHVVLGSLLRRPLAQIPDLHGLLTGYLGLPESGYDKPLFMGQGLRDTDVITPETLRFGATLIANRQPVTLRTYPTDHSGAVAASLPDSLPFVAHLLAGPTR